MPQRCLTPAEIEKILFNVYMDMKMGRKCEHSAYNEAYVLGSMLKAIELRDVGQTKAE